MSRFEHDVRSGGLLHSGIISMLLEEKVKQLRRASSRRLTPNARFRFVNQKVTKSAVAPGMLPVSCVEGLYDRFPLVKIYYEYPHVRFEILNQL